MSHRRGVNYSEGFSISSNSNVNCFMVRQDDGERAIVLLDNGMEIGISKGMRNIYEDPASLQSIQVQYGGHGNLKVILMDRTGMNRQVPQVDINQFRLVRPEIIPAKDIMEALIERKVAFLKGCR